MTTVVELGLHARRTVVRAVCKMSSRVLSSPLATLPPNPREVVCPRRPGEDCGPETERGTGQGVRCG